MKPRDKEILEILKKLYKGARIALDFDGNFQLLVAVILSAQCTDERVNMVTPKLFKVFPDAASFARASQEEVETLIYSTGFYRNKAKNIIGASKIIIEKFGGKVPNKMEDLLSLPGVARKTANVVMSEAFGKSEGIVVDTHVTRLSHRLGFLPKKMAGNKNAVKIEKQLMKTVAKKDWAIFPHLLILHGRKYCKARRALCEACPLNKLCPSAFKV